VFDIVAQMLLAYKEFDLILGGDRMGEKRSIDPIPIDL
jgi:hypothetical protein